ncbi:MAG TPA: hypothetical protein DIS90_02035 [Cytophagales bacterium]|nr:hypothetical protein [Cytophagales bacterium]
MKLQLTILALLFYNGMLYAQRVPNEVENIDYLITYGAQAPLSRGDDDHVQILFFSVPYNYKSPVYIRVYDPDTGGTHDEIHGSANTKVKFAVYGGNEAFSNKDAQKINPTGKYNSGSLLASKIFGSESIYDANWYTFGPFNPLQGEQSDALNGYIFKLIIEGLQGDDGNQYRCFFSEQPNMNRSIEGANAFAYEYTFKLPKARGVSHIYPFIDRSVVSVTQNNFDFDKDGSILLYSVAKNRHEGSVSGDNEWAQSKHIMKENEKNTTLDIQIQKQNQGENAMSIYITNQYDEAIAFFAVPIGGPPKYKYDLKVTLKSSTGQN